MNTFVVFRTTCVVRRVIVDATFARVLVVSNVDEDVGTKGTGPGVVSNLLIPAERVLLPIEYRG